MELDAKTKVNLNYIFEVRWIASEKTAVLQVINGYEVLMTDLRRIANSNQRIDGVKSFDSKTRSTAVGLEKKLADKRFLMMLCFLADILSILAAQSLEFQRRYGYIFFIEYQALTPNFIKSHRYHILQNSDLIFFRTKKHCLPF